jgi:hypothetical protein
LIPATEVPTSVTDVVIVSGTTAVIISATAVPPSVTNTIPVPTSPSPSPILLTTVPSTLPSPPTPSIVAAFPSSDIREVVHESTSTVVRTSNYITPSNSPTAPSSSFNVISSIPIEHVST